MNDDQARRVAELTAALEQIVLECEDVTEDSFEEIDLIARRVLGLPPVSEP
jgi:hypothetical protein